MADRWMVGDLATLDDYIPTPPSNMLGDIAQGVVDYAKRPGQTMAANPYPPNSEEAQFFEDQRRSNTYRIAPETALNMVGMGTPFAPTSALGMAGGKIKTPAPGALAATSEYRPPFYSAVEQAVQGAKQNAAPGQQWAGFLRNQPGVKPEEVEALGLGKLFEQPGSVPKEAVLGEIAANKVNVGEVIKSERSQQPAAQRVNLIDEQLHAIQGEFDRLHRRSDGLPIDTAAASERRATLAAQERELRTERAGIVANWQERSSGDTKFQQYTLPGGENYREMLLTLPKKPKDIGPAPELLTELPKGPDWDNSYRVIRYRGDGPEREWGVIPPGQSHARAMAGQHPTEAEAVRQALNHINAQNAQQYNQALHDANKSGQFTSSHFDEPNVLAHVRYNDRVIDGKKTLFVEEVQSDWHQKGKREGYQGRETDEQRALTEERDRLAGEVAALQMAHRRGQELANITPQMDRITAINEQLGQPYGGNTRVPDAPFKTTWPELAMKRIIREAAEKGYDKVAWTPGSVQAARYPEQLRQHVDEIAWSSPGTPRSNPEGLRYVHAKPRAGGMDLVFTVNKDGMITEASAAQAKGQHVEDIFGKDMSRQIMEKADGEIASKDFVIGAKGQQGFYDEILPSTVNKLVKKHGGRVGQGELRTAEENPLVFKLKDNGYDPETVNIQQILADNGGRLPRWLNDAELNAINMGEHLDIAGIKGDKVHTLDITPSLRAAAMKGFPLFTAGGVAATGIMGEMARQDEYR